MKFKFGAGLLLVSTSLLPQTLVAQPAFTGKSTLEQKTLMKNWALSICFAQITQDSETKKDAGLTASAYLENSQQELEDFEKIEKIVEEFTALKYGGSVASQYNTMKCIDMFHSKKLDQLTSKLVKRR